MTSRVLGVVREQVLAALFGAGHAMDAYTIAFRIPNIARDLFAEGAMSAAFVPTFTRQLTRSGRDAAWRLGNLVLNALLLVTGTVVLLGIVFAGDIVRVMARDFAAVPGKLELTVLLTRMMFPFLLLVSVAAVAMGMLQALHRFVVPALAPAMFNVSTIACALVLVPLMPAAGMPPIAAIAIGTLVGGVAQVAVQWPLLRREGFAYRPILDWGDDGVRRILLLMGPGTLGLAATQVNVLVNAILATGEGEGAVSWLNYAFRLMNLPMGLFGVSIATAALPLVARQAARGDPSALRDSLRRAFTLTLVLNVPATVGLIVLGEPIVRVIFERGAFTAADTVATAAALQGYAIGLVGYAAVRIATPSFYALGQSRTPVLVSIAAVAANLVINLVLVRRIGYAGLALGTSIAAIGHAATLIYLLERRVPGVASRHLAASLVRITVASVVMGAAAVALERALEAWIPGDVLVLRIVRLAGSIGGAIVVLAGAAWVLGLRELTEAMAALRARLLPPAGDGER
jgi:putative peptidoglycan lipid II flippase